MVSSMLNFVICLIKHLFLKKNITILSRLQ
ncbi:hypothetical protein Golob_006304, partial [Gossypium lobatum]|nr:hypothetical protein [Gossypium lobatum]